MAISPLHGCEKRSKEQAREDEADNYSLQDALSLKRTWHKCTVWG